MDSFDEVAQQSVENPKWVNMDVVESRKHDRSPSPEPEEQRSKKQKIVVPPSNAHFKFGAYFFDGRITQEKGPQTRMLEYAASQNHMFHVQHETVNLGYKKQLAEYNDGKRVKPPPKTYRAYGSYLNRAEFLRCTKSLSVSLHTFYEWIPSETVVRLHWDAEYELKGQEESEEFAAECKQQQCRFIANHLAPALLKLGIDITTPEYKSTAVLACGTRKELNKPLKVSYHGINSVLFENNHRALHLFMHGLVLPSLLKDEDMLPACNKDKKEEWKRTMIDMGIYTKFRVFRLPGEHKASDNTRTPMEILYGDFASACVVPEAGEVKSRVITEADIRKVLGDRAPPQQSKPKHERKNVRKHSDPTDPILLQVTALLRKHGDSQSMAIERLDKLIRCTHSGKRECSSAPGGVHDNLVCYCVLGGASGEDVFKFCHGDNCANSKQRNPTGTHLGKLKSGMDSDDTFTFYDFTTKYNGHNCDTEKEQILEDARRVFAVVDAGEGTWIRKSRREGQMYLDMTRSKHKHTSDPDFINDKNKRVRWHDFVQQNKTRLPRYTHMGCYPDPAVAAVETTAFNLFNGFKAKLLAPDDIRRLQPVLDVILYHLYNVLLRNEPVSTREFINAWFHTSFKFPWKRIGAAVFFISETQGLGKGAFLNQFLPSKVYGPGLSLQLAGIEELDDQWTYEWVGKFYVYFDELTAAGAKKASLWTKLKNRSTEPKIKATRKGIDSFPADLHANIMGSSNEYGALRIDQRDRRIVPIDCTAPHSPDAEYFKTLFRAFDTPGAGDAFFTYMYNKVHLDDYNFIKHLPQNDIRRESQQSSTCYATQFLQELKCGGLSATGLDIGGSIRSGDLYKRYKTWCELNNVNSKFVVDGIQFGKKVSRHLPSKHTVGGTVYELEYSRVPDMPHQKAEKAEQSEDDAMLAELNRVELGV